MERAPASPALHTLTWALSTWCLSRFPLLSVHKEVDGQVSTLQVPTQQDTKHPAATGNYHRGAHGPHIAPRLPVPAGTATTPCRPPSQGPSPLFNTPCFPRACSRPPFLPPSWVLGFLPVTPSTQMSQRETLECESRCRRAGIVPKPWQCRARGSETVLHPRQARFSSTSTSRSPLETVP